MTPFIEAIYRTRYRNFCIHRNFRIFRQRLNLSLLPQVPIGGYSPCITGNREDDHYW